MFPHQQDISHDGPVHGQEGLSEENENLKKQTENTAETK